MKQIITTIECDMPHKTPREATVSVRFVISGKTRQAREIDLCNECAQKQIEPVFRNARIARSDASLLIERI